MNDGTKPSTVQQPGGAPGILHVMFHGTFVFDFHKDHIDVLVPQVEEHVYRVGSWLGETELICDDHASAMDQSKPMDSGGHNHNGGNGGPDRYQLEGVKGGSAMTLPPENNLMVSARLKQDVDSLLYARIRVPLPDQIRTPRRALLPNGDFDPKEGLPKDYQGKLGTIQIFTYNFPDDSALRFYCHPGHALWEPAFAGGAVTLHIFAAPEHFHLMPATKGRATSHVQNAFASCAALFQDFKVEMRQLPEKNEFDKNDLPEKAVPEETEDLAPRIRRLSQLGRMRKDNRDLNLLWYASEALDGDPDACGNFGRHG
jgi:hypothetical protein